MGYDSIIFDLDGTLWDSSILVAKSWSEELSLYDYERKSVSVEEITSCMGLKMDKIAEKLFPQLDEETRADIMSKCCERENMYLSIHGGSLYEKLEETLKVLSKKYKMIIVSNCQDGYIESFFKAHGLQKYFIDYECPGRTGLDKGKNIKLVIERNNIKNAIYVGDTLGDANSAKCANIPFVYAKYGFGEVNNFEYSVDSFSELLNIF